ncbi:MAG: AbrB/MazE/SpoVT family DNA-binding domain-containing protein [Candidatus Heimdallarchaeota archaeon]|nr:AbrB/MazE/SpoVT family DNA-binding domain-containing protein [Candidatus Heimdallarchaeota archaeon]
MKISKKGQIVIPKHLRDRLNVEHGMEVQFRIRGQILQVELKTDVRKDIEYLKSKDLAADTLDEESIRSITRDLVYQQFYTGTDDTLTDRVGKRKLKIRGADSIISEVINIITHCSRFWMEGDPVQTIKAFSEEFELDFSTVLARFADKIRSMLLGGDDLIALMGAEVVYAMALGEVLSQFRTRIGDIVTEYLFKEANQREYIEKLGYETVEDLITKSLADEYSILMNLKVLQEFAKINLNSVGRRAYNKLSEEMLDSYEGEETPDHIIKRRERRARRQGKTYVPPQKKGKGKKKKDTVDEDIKLEEVSDDDFDIPDMPDFDF